MGKTDFYLYGLRGKVGNLVGRKGRKGGTVLGKYQPAVKNPQTNRQMATRIILATVAQAAKYMAPIINHSFEGVAVGADSKDKFRQLNQSALRRYAAIDYEELPKAVDAHVFMTTKGISQLIPNRYVISKGSLPAPKCYVDQTPASGAHTTPYSLAIKFPEVTLTAKGTTQKYVTLGELLHGFFGIGAVGEQLTLVLIQRASTGYIYAYQQQPEIGGWQIPYTNMKAQRLFLSLDLDLSKPVEITDAGGTPVEDIAETVTDAIFDAFDASEKSDSKLVEAFRNFFYDALQATYTAGASTLALAWDATFPGYDIDTYNADNTGVGHVFAAGIIRSRLMDNGSWQYSNAQMLTARPDASEIKRNFGLEWGSAIQAWFEKEQIADDNEYLQAGGSQNEIGESFT